MSSVYTVERPPLAPPAGVLARLGWELAAAWWWKHRPEMAGSDCDAGRVGRRCLTWRFMDEFLAEVELARVEDEEGAGRAPQPYPVARGVARVPSHGGGGRS